MVAALSGELRVKPVADQRVGVRAGNDVNRSAVATVAAARPAAGDAELAAEREAPATAVTGFDVNVYLVNKHSPD